MTDAYVRSCAVLVWMLATAAPLRSVRAQGGDTTKVDAAQNDSIAAALFAAAPGSAKAAATARNLQQRATDPTLTSPTSAPSTTLQLNASTQGQKTAELQAAVKPIPIGGSTFFQASAKATAPLDTANTSQDLLDLTGLQKSTSIAVAVGFNGGWRARWGPKAEAACLHFWNEVRADSAPVFEKMRDTLQTHRDAIVTRAELLETSAAALRSAPGADAGPLKERLQNVEDEVKHLRDSVKTYNEQIADAGRPIARLDRSVDPTSYGCGKDLLLHHYHVRPNDKYAALVDSVIGAITTTDAWVLGAKGTLGMQDASYTDSSTLKPIKHQATTYGISAGAGRFIDPINGVLAADFVASQTYKAAPSGQLCTQVGVKAALHCVNASLQAPQKQNHAVGAIELREAFTSVAFNPEFDYDFRTYAAVLKMPIYVFKSASGGLSGGVTFGWQVNQTHQITLQAFIGNAFSLLAIPGT